MPDLLVVALEASADLHGAAVMRELTALMPTVRFFGAGGPRMRAAGCEALVRAEHGGHDEIDHLVAFLENSERGIAR